MEETTSGRIRSTKPRRTKTEETSIRSSCPHSRRREGSVGCSSSAHGSRARCSGPRCCSFSLWRSSPRSKRIPNRSYTNSRNARVSFPFFRSALEVLTRIVLFSLPPPPPGFIPPPGLAFPPPGFPMPPGCVSHSLQSEIGHETADCVVCVIVQYASTWHGTSPGLPHATFPSSRVSLLSTLEHFTLTD